MSVNYDKTEIVIDILRKRCIEYGHKDIFEIKENKYLLLLLLNNFRVINDNSVKGILKWRSNRTLKNNLEKAEETLFINKEFRDKYLEIEECIYEKIRNAK